MDKKKRGNYEFTGRTKVSGKSLVIPILASDPTAPAVGEVWFNSTDSKLKIRKDASTTLATGALT